MNHLNIIPALSSPLSLSLLLKFNRLCFRLQVPSISSITLLEDLPFFMIFDLFFSSGDFYPSNKHSYLCLHLC